ncbi:MAG: hypothetical protein WCP35_19565 [Verrucomicrobiota bacterium]
MRPPTLTSVGGSWWSTNTGNSNLSGLALNIDGPDASMFSLTTQPTAPVSGPTGTTTFAVTFSAGSGLLQTGTIHQLEW